MKSVRLSNGGGELKPSTITPKHRTMAIYHNPTRREYRVYVLIRSVCTDCGEVSYRWNSMLKMSCDQLAPSEKDFPSIESAVWYALEQGWEVSATTYVIGFYEALLDVQRIELDAFKKKGGK